MASGGLDLASRCGKITGREGGSRESDGVHSGEMTEVDVELWSQGLWEEIQRLWSEERPYVTG